MDKERNKRLGDEGGEAERTAAAWVLRCDRGLTPDEQDELSSWLAEDPRHGTALARSREDWKRLDKLGRWRPEHSSQPNPDLLAPSVHYGWNFRWKTGLLAIAAALVVGLLLYRTAAPNTAATRLDTPSMASVGNQRLLDDGSMVELNRGAVLTVNFTPTERRVLLEGGEAYFSVAKDASRPFIVTAGDVDVRAIGTAFNVRLRDTGVDVVVAEGHVQLTASRVDPLGRLVKSAGPSTEGAVLKSRQQASVSFLPSTEPLQISTLSVGEMGAALAWQHRLLDFNSVPLREVVAEFNRRNHVQLLVMDDDLASIPISASFRSDNIDGFLRLLEAGFDARAERRGESEIMLYRGR
jgi:transmembrane sensor